MTLVLSLRPIGSCSTTSTYVSSHACSVSAPDLGYLQAASTQTSRSASTRCGLPA